MKLRDISHLQKNENFTVACKFAVCDNQIYVQGQLARSPMSQEVEKGQFRNICIG